MDSNYNSFETYLKLLADGPHDGTPMVLSSPSAVSLHFDAVATQSIMLRTEPNKLVLSYTQSMMGFLLLQPAPARISMIGLGGGSLLKYCYGHLPDTKVVAIEIDPAVIALRDTFLIPPDNERIEVICADGAEYVKRRDAQPEVILVDGFLVDGMPAQLGSATFYAECHARLADDGVLVANFLDTDANIPRYLDEARSVFGGSLSISLSDDGCNYTLFAWKGATTLPSQIELLGRARALEGTHPLNLRSSARLLGAGQKLASDQIFWQKLAG